MAESSLFHAATRIVASGINRPARHIVTSARSGCLVASFLLLTTAFATSARPAVARAMEDDGAGEVAEGELTGSNGSQDASSAPPPHATAPPHAPDGASESSAGESSAGETSAGETSPDSDEDASESDGASLQSGEAASGFRVLKTPRQIHDAFHGITDSGDQVDLTGTLVLYDNERQNCFVQRGGMAVYVGFPSGTWPALSGVRPGDLVRVHGVLGDALGAVRASSISVVGRGELPSPVSESLTRLPLGRHWGQWIVHEGVVQHATCMSDGTYFGLVYDTVYFSVRIAEPMPLDQVKGLIGSRVRISGALACENAKGSLERFIIYAMARDQLEVMEAGEPVETFRPTAIDLLQPDAEKGVYFEGVLAHVNRYRRVLVEDGAASITVNIPLTDRLYRGASVEVYGTCRRAGEVDALILCQHGAADLRSPARMTAAEFMASPSPMGRVDMCGNIVSFGSYGNERRLHLESDGVLFYAVFEADDPTFEALHLDQAADVRLHGCAMRLPKNVHDEAFRVLVPPGETVTVQSLRADAVWRKIYSVLFGVILAGVAAVLMITGLRHKVKSRTSELAYETARLQAAYDAVHEGVLVLDDAGLSSRCNQRFLEMFDLKSPPDTRQEFIHRLGCWIDPDARFQIWCHGIMDSVDACETRVFPTTDKVPRWLQVYSAPVHLRSNTDGELRFGRIWTFDDVTERRRLENQVRESQKMDAVGQLAGGIAHDFNNTLATILANVELMREQPESAIKECFDQIDDCEKSIQRAVQLIRSLLEYSRDTRLEKTIRDVNQLIVETEHFIRSTVGSLVDVRVVLDEDPQYIHGDPVRLQQVLINLCLNARDAITDSGVIRIETHSITRNDERFVEIRVSDTGCGIASEDISRVFDPFYSTKDVGKGAGLGLSMCYGIVSQHSGTMTVDSTVGIGSTFTIRLPLLNDGQVDTILDEPSILRDTPHALSMVPPSKDGGLVNSGAGDGAVSHFSSSDQPADDSDVSLVPVASHEASQPAMNFDENPRGESGGESGGESRRTDPGGRWPGNRPPRILLADDEDVLRRAVSLLLNQSGFQVDEAIDGLQAVEMIGEERPPKYDVVLLDVTMPRLSGIEALERLRRVHPDLPVIMLSGRIMLDAFKTGSQRPNAVFRKPMKTRRLIDAIYEVMRETAQHSP